MKSDTSWKINHLTDIGVDICIEVVILYSNIFLFNARSDLVVKKTST